MNLHLIRTLLFLTALSLCACAHRTEVPPQVQTQRMMDDLHGVISKTVRDPAKAERLRLLAEQANRQAGELTRISHEYQQRINTLNRDYNSTSEDFAAIFDEYGGRRPRMQQAMLATLFEMKALVTAKEWKAISGIERKMLEHRLKNRREH